jgi:hypothetical protein
MKGNHLRGSPYVASKDDENMGKGSTLKDPGAASQAIIGGMRQPPLLRRYCMEWMGRSFDLTALVG